MERDMTVWKELQNSSFFDATARERAIGLVDDGSFNELCGPEYKMMSPHLKALDEPSQFDDGVVTGVGKIGERLVFVISQEGSFIGGAVGEIHGAKIVKTLSLAEEAYTKCADKYGDRIDEFRPIVVISFDTGGVRLHEANAGLLAHSEIMDGIQRLRKKVPVFGLSGGKVGTFGGMGFVIAATDIIIMSSKGRIGLTGPEVIEQEMGRSEFDASDKSLIYRTTGGKHKYIVGDCNCLVDDTISEFSNAIKANLSLTMDGVEAMRRIGSLSAVKKQMNTIDSTCELKFKDSLDLWKYAGNENPQILVDLSVEDFLKTASKLSV